MHVYAKSISTNRLHSAILGAICGKPVTLGPSSSHKNKSVWQYSLASGNVRWAHSIEPPNRWRLLPARIRNSHRMRQLHLAFIECQFDELRIDRYELIFTRFRGSLGNKLTGFVTDAMTKW